ncbi:MAG: RNA methyltransferase [Acidobacteriaceae bacterium]
MEKFRHPCPHPKICIRAYLMDPDRLRVVLVSTRNPLNIGAASRAMCNFGFHRLRVVHPYELAFREARSAVGAAAVLTNAEEFQSVADAVADCTLVIGATAIGHRQPQQPVKPLKDGAASILQELNTPPNHPSRVAILFGSEKVGLSNGDLSHCHWLLHIPTREEQPSMNLGQAVAVCLYEIACQTAVSSPPVERPLASSEEVERVTGLLLETLHASEYIGAKSPDSQQEAMRRLVRRLRLSSEDASTWLGILRQILWKLRTKT